MFARRSFHRVHRIIPLPNQSIEDLDYLKLIVVVERKIAKNRHLAPPL
jgi:hypothetical protein